MRKLLSLITALTFLLGSVPFSVGQSGATLPQPSRSAGVFYAASYGKWVAHTGTNTAASPGAIVADVGLPTSSGSSDARQFNPFQGSFPKGGGFVPLLVDVGSAQESVTPTATGGCTTPQNQSSSGSLCTLTGTFAQAHGANAYITSATFGLQEAINDAAQSGGGVVVVDSGWLGTTAQLLAASVAANVTILDYRNGAPSFLNPLGGATTLAAPATLTALTAVPSTTVVGTFTATAYNMCIAYVDLLGQEGPCSTSFVNTGAGATSSFQFTAPAASTGAVGYTIYVGLTAAGSTTLQYKVPLVAQPSVVGSYPASNGVCTLTQIELITPACALTNTSFGQTGSTASVIAITVNTSPIQPQSTTTSTTSVYVPNPGGRTTYTYAPGSHVGIGNAFNDALAFTIGAAAATTVPNVVGTINVGPGFMNAVGKTLEICGEATTTASAATIVDIQFQWDAFGQNTAGKGVVIGDLTATPAAAIATAGHATFCADFQTTVASASATGGSINHVNGYGAVGGVSLIAPGALSDALTPGAVGSLNLADSARINVIYLHTTGTDGAGWTLQNLSAKLI